MLQNFIQLFDAQTLLIFLATLFLAVWWSRSGDGAWKGGPPGPYALPILGNALQLAGQKDQYLVFEKMAKKYGSIFRFYMGSMRVVVLTGYDNIREGLVDKGASLIDRPNTMFLPDKLFRQKGLGWSNGDLWKHSRRFALVSLRDFGVGKSSLEEKIQDEAEIIMEGMESLNGRPFDPKEHMVDGVANIIFGIIRGSRYEHTDPEFREALRLLEFAFTFTNGGNIIPENFAPWLRFLPLGTPGRKLIQNDAKLRDIMAREIQTHRESFDPENIRDFIDLFLKMTAEEPTNSAFEEDNLFRMLIDLFLAGSESTSTVLCWTMLYMTRFPEIQKLCQQEIEQVVGEGRKVCFKDKDSLPLCTATINEVLRIGNIAPTTVPHRAVEDTVLGGYNIPKGTMIMFSIYSAHHDPKYWKDSHNFDPMRWINEAGKCKKLEGFIPFSEGLRTCLGKSLSEMEMFLFFTNFIQRFTFKTVEGAPLPSLEGTRSGITRMPQPFEMCAVRVS